MKHMASEQMDGRDPLVVQEALRAGAAPDQKWPMLWAHRTWPAAMEGRAKARPLGGWVILGYLQAQGSHSLRGLGSLPVPGWAIMAILGL